MVVCRVLSLLGTVSMPFLSFNGAALTTDASEKLGYVLTITLLVGLFSLLFGVLRLGFIVSFISTPVLNGFASAAAIITTVSVLKDWFRTTPAKATNVFVNLFNLFVSMKDTHGWSVVLGVSAMLALVGLKKWKRTSHLPGALVVVVIFIAVTALIDVLAGGKGTDGGVWWGLAGRCRSWCCFSRERHP